MNAQALGQRIAGALTSQITSAELAAVLNDASQADAAARKAYEAAEGKALDPLTPADELPALRTAMEDARFLRDRLARGTSSLNDRLEEVLAAERLAEGDQKRAEALALQEAAAARLRVRYPLLAAEMAAIMQECAEVDSAEGLTGTTSFQLAGWRNAVRSVRIPKLDEERGYVWPKG